MLNLLAFDIETTGLFPKEHDILEIAYAGVQIDRDGSFEVDEIQHTYIKTPAFLLKAHMEDNVWKMHSENGLIEDLHKNTGKIIQHAEIEIVQYIVSCFGESKPQLCGNSIAFDRDFIKVKMPEVDKKLHYRMIDLSCIRTLAKYFGNYTFAEGGSKHRAKSDCEYIVEQLQLIKGLLSNIQEE